MAVRSIDTIEDAIATQPGVVVDHGEIHIRSGRPTEVKRHVEGIQISDPCVDANPMEGSWTSLSAFEMISSGFDAEYANLQSGVIDLRTREGHTSLEIVIRPGAGRRTPDRSYAC